MQNSTNVGGFLHRGSTTKNEVISKEKRMDRGAARTKGDSRKVRVKHGILQTYRKLVDSDNK
jgi:hypothetical protein